MLFNAKSSPHGKTKRQNRRATHMERQRAPPKGREALIVEDAYQRGYADAIADMRKKKSRGGSGSRQRKPAAGISLSRKPTGLQCWQLPCWQYGRQRAT